MWWWLLGAIGRLRDDLAAVLGPPVNDLRLGRRGDRWFAEVPDVVDGVPVFRGDTSVRGVGPRAGLVGGLALLGPKALRSPRSAACRRYRS